MIDVEDAHVGAPAPAALLHHFGGGVEDAHEAHGAAGHAAGAAHLVAPGPEMGEGKAGAAAGLMDQGHVPHALQDGAHVVKHRDDEAGGQLSLRQAGVHQGGGVGQEFQGTQGLVEVCRPAGHGLRAAVAFFGRRHPPGHPEKQFLRRLHYPAVGVTAEIALFQDPQGNGPEFQRGRLKHKSVLPSIPK